MILAGSFTSCCKGGYKVATRGCGFGVCRFGLRGSGLSAKALGFIGVQGLAMP